MPYQNLTSVLDTTATTPISTAIAAVQTSLAPHTVNLTPEEILGMYKMSTGRQSMGIRALQIARDNPTLVPAYLNVGAAVVDMDRYTNLVSLAMKLRALTEAVEHGYMASGSEVMLFVKGFYSSLQAAAEQNVPGAGALAQELAVYYDLPGKPDGGTPVTPTP